MPFKRWDTHRVTQRRSLRLNTANLHIGRDAYKEIGSPERVDVLFDTEAKAIKLEATEDGRKVAPDPPHFSIRLAKVMPTGKYNLTTDNIFVFQESDHSPEALPTNNNLGGEK